MIIAVEGTSAAGKTTWCTAHAGDALVPEFAEESGSHPDPDDLSASAAYWMGVNSERWQRAEWAERLFGLAVCDTDPLKLHYSWCLARIGVAPIERFRHEAAIARSLFAEHRLGMCDLAFVALPPPEELRRRREQDPARRRRHFALHARLRKPLHEWYRAMDTLDDLSRVRWELPSTGLPGDRPPTRPDRTDPALLDGLIAALPLT